MALAGGCSPSSPLQLKPKAHDDGDCEQNEDESHVLDLVPAEALLQLVKKKKKKAAMSNLVRLVSGEQDSWQGAGEAGSGLLERPGNGAEQDFIAEQAEVILGTQGGTAQHHAGLGDA